MTILLEDVTDMPELVVDWWDRTGNQIFAGVEPLFVYVAKKILEERKLESNH